MRWFQRGFGLFGGLLIAVGIASAAAAVAAEELIGWGRATRSGPLRARPRNRDEDARRRARHDAQCIPRGRRSALHRAGRGVADRRGGLPVRERHEDVDLRYDAPRARTRCSLRARPSSSRGAATARCGSTSTASASSPGSSRSWGSCSRTRASTRSRRWSIRAGRSRSANAGSSMPSASRSSCARAAFARSSSTGPQRRASRPATHDLLELHYRIPIRGFALPEMPEALRAPFQGQPRGRRELDAVTGCTARERIPPRSRSSSTARSIRRALRARPRGASSDRSPWISTRRR